MEQLFFCAHVEILCMPQSIASRLQTADCFLERFLIGFAHTHDFAYGTHLGSQLVLHAFEFFKRPACKFDYHIIAIRNVFVQGAVFSTGDIL